MFKNLLSRIIQLLSVVVGLVLLVFILFQALPGPEQILSGQRTDNSTREAIVEELGLDEPVYVQALGYLNDVSVISIYAESKTPKGIKGLCLIPSNNYQLWVKLPYMRKSFQTQQQVSAILWGAFGGTAVLALAALIVAGIIGIPLGVLAALKANSKLDYTIVGFSTLGISIPSFFSAMLFSWIFGFVLHDFTGLSMTGSLYELDALGENYSLRLDHLILPAVALGIRPVAVFIQLTRNTMVEILNQDYIQLAKAKGLKESVVIWRHAFPNALNPIITSIGGWFSSLLAGSFFTEYIFQWKGLGKVTIEALQQSDFPIVMGGVLFTACVFFIIHSLTELMYVWIDPRLKH